MVINDDDNADDDDMMKKIRNIKEQQQVPNKPINISPVVLLVRYIMKNIVNNDNNMNVNNDMLIEQFNTKYVHPLNKLLIGVGGGGVMSSSNNTPLLTLNDNNNFIITANDVNTALYIISSSINNITNNKKRMREDEKEDDDNDNEGYNIIKKNKVDTEGVTINDNHHHDNNNNKTTKRRIDNNDNDYSYINKEWLYMEGRRILNISTVKYLCQRIGISNNNIIEKSELISSIVDSIWAMNNKELYWLYTGKMDYNIENDNEFNNNKYRNKLLKGIISTTTITPRTRRSRDSLTLPQHKECNNNKSENEDKNNDDVDDDVDDITTLPYLPILILNNSKKIIELAKSNPWKLFTLKSLNNNNNNRRGEGDGGGGGMMECSSSKNNDNNEMVMQDASIENLGKSFIKLLKIVKDENAINAIRHAKRELETTIKLYNQQQQQQKEEGRGSNVYNNTAAPDPAAAATSHDGTSYYDYDTNCDFGKIVHQALNNTHCPFATLGLDNNDNNVITITDVKKRWAKLILILHPDKAPVNWKNNKDNNNNMITLLSDAVQKVNDAKKKCESLLECKTVKRPPTPIISMYDNDIYKICKSKSGKRTIEIHWTSPPLDNNNNKIDKYYVFLQLPDKLNDERYPVGSVVDSSDPWIVISEDDARFSKFFYYDRMIVYVTSFNSAGYSKESLTINIPLNNNGIKLSLLPRPPPPHTHTSSLNKEYDNNKRWYNNIISSLLLLRNDITTLRTKLSKLRVDELKNIIRYNIKQQVPRGNKPLLIETITDAIINNNINYIA